MSGIEELISAGNFFVAEYEKKIIGCGGRIAGVYEPQKAEIRGFSVHPDFARKGVVTHILDACENECLRRGIKALYLIATLAGKPFFKKKVAFRNLIDLTKFCRMEKLLHWSKW